MSTEYYKGIELTQVPTGFAVYTGLAITNSGNFPIQYSLSISDTILTGIDPEDKKDTLFITDSISSFDGKNSIFRKTINPSDSGIFYILHKPIVIDATGYETATISIESASSAGDSDDLITIDITGHRITGCPIPDKLGKFYAVQDYNFENGFNLNFNFTPLSGNAFITGIGIDLGLDSSFSSLVGGATNYFAVLNNGEQESLPLYGGYPGLIGKEFSFSVNNLSINQDYYARVFPINCTGGTGAYTYPTGFTKIRFPTLSNEAYSGFLSSPGSNLAFVPGILYIDYQINDDGPLDLLQIIKNNNNNSDNLLFYSGVNIKFSPEGENPIGYIRGKEDNAPLYLIKPENGIEFGTGLGGVFKLELEFENISVLGFGGEGATAGSPAKNGGPIFNFDNLNYSSSAGGAVDKIFNYYIYKDVDSSFTAGLGGGAGWLITDDTDNKTQYIIEGRQVTYADFINLIQIP